MISRKLLATVAGSMAVSIAGGPIGLLIASLNTTH